ncbi:MAG: response regulator [Planctomycetota bacterium]
MEDEPIVQLHLRTILQDLGYVVTDVASTCAEALASAQRDEPHLVLMDIRISGGTDGIETARELRARHDLDVVFLTAYADEGTVGRAQTVGPIGYLVKPFSMPQLRATLSTARLRQVARADARTCSIAPVQGQPFGKGTRIAIFSHDTLGLGHLQRNLNIAWALTRRFPELSVLLLTGSSALHRYPLPPGVDTIKLPSVRKVSAERYEARSLKVGDDQVLDLRTDLSLHSIQGFDPHVLLVDHSPLGMGGELLPTLEWLKRNRPDCVRILGLRDIVDSPKRVARSWARQRIPEVLEELYHHVLVYGMPDVFDVAVNYSFSARLRARLEYCGYVGRFRPAGEELETVLPPKGNKPLVFVTIGGGDGAGEEVLGSVLRMLQTYRAQLDFETVLLGGPFLDPVLAARFRQECEGLPAKLVDFVDSTRPYLERADLVVCTGGYNTMVETANYAAKALVIPRHGHREEQLIRARRFAELGLVSTLHSAEATPERLFAEVSRLLSDAHRPLAEARAKATLQFDGALRVTEFCGRLEVTC